MNDVTALPLKALDIFTITMEKKQFDAVRDISDGLTNRQTSSIQYEKKLPGWTRGFHWLRCVTFLSKMFKFLSKRYRKTLHTILKLRINWKEELIYAHCLTSPTCSDLGQKNYRNATPEHTSETTAIDTEWLNKRRRKNCGHVNTVINTKCDNHLPKILHKIVHETIINYANNLKFMWCVVRVTPRQCAAVKLDGHSDRTSKYRQSRYTHDGHYGTRHTNTLTQSLKLRMCIAENTNIDKLPRSLKLNCVFYD